MNDNKTNESIGAVNCIQITPSVIWTGPLTATDNTHSVSVSYPPQTEKGAKTAPAVKQATTCPCCDCVEDDCSCSDQCAMCTCGERPGYLMPLKNADPEADEERETLSVGAGRKSREPATIDFGFKADPQEVEIDGEVGLLCKGFASRYNEEDAVGEEQLPGAFRAFGEEWFAQAEPLVLFNHAMDSALGARPIGRGISYKMLPDGIYVEVFVPKSAADSWQDKRAKKRFGEIYQGIKSAVIRGFSVGGAFTRFGKKLANWATVELSITPAPCLASATFALGRKAVIERYGAVPMGLGDIDGQQAQSQSVLGLLTRPHWNTAMGLAKKDGAQGLHDHLLGYEPALQGQHDSEDCPLCVDRRDMMGVKAKSRDAYLVAEGDNESDWHLPVKKGAGYDRGLCGAAWAALHDGYRGNKYEGPNKAQALAKLTRIYKSQGWDLPGSNGSGGKSEDSALDAQEVLTEATAFLAEFSRGVKAGKRHSADTRAAVKFVVDHLNSVFQLDDEKDEGSNA